MKEILEIISQNKDALSYEGIAKSLTKDIDLGFDTDKIQKELTKEMFGDLLGMEDMKESLGGLVPENIKEFLGFDSTPELKDVEQPDTMGPHMPTETGNMVEGKSENAIQEASRSINDPSTDNQGVNRDMSQATVPNAVPVDSTGNLFDSVHSPPANRTNFL